MIYTSYYAKAYKYKEDYLLCNIARYIPKWVDKDDVIDLSVLSPSEQLLKDYKANKVTEDEYKERYINELLSYKSLDELGDIFKSMEYQSEKEGIDVILLCYESSDKFCHRHILTNLLKDYITIKELEEL